MPLYQIRRSFPSATERDLDSAAARSLSCLAWFEGMRWIRSYWDPTSESTLCYYEAASIGDVVAHAEKASIPCDEIREVTEILPERFEIASSLS